MTILIILLGVLVSMWNAFVAGACWRSREVPRLLLWCALIMSACGFTQAYVAVIGSVAASAHWITPRAAQALFSLEYLLILAPVLGAGTIITIHSWQAFLRTRSWLDGAAATYNTGAMISNVYEASRAAPSAMGNVLEFFTSSDGDSDSDGALAKIVVGLLLLIAVLLAVGTTQLFFGIGYRTSLRQALA